MLVKRLGDIVIGPSLQAFDQIFFQALRGEQQDVGVRVFILVLFVTLVLFADIPAHFRARQTRHHPVENRELRRVRGLQHLPGLDAVTGDDYLVSPLPQGSVEQMPRNDAVIGDQNPHSLVSPTRVRDSSNYSGVTLPVYTIG